MPAYCSIEEAWGQTIESNLENNYRYPSEPQIEEKTEKIKKKPKGVIRTELPNSQYPFIGDEIGGLSDTDSNNGVEEFSDNNINECDCEKCNTQLKGVQELYNKFKLNEKVKIALEHFFNSNKIKYDKSETIEIKKPNKLKLREDDLADIITFMLCGIMLIFIMDSYMKYSKK
tara:strand:- start:517 stop:1035 length:519 start_codon:yes stop_codon:yes gene_type:complete